MSVTDKKLAADGVRLALLNNRLQGVARKMANTLLRTGRSGVLNIARDFSCAIVTADCELLAAAESLPNSRSLWPRPHGQGHESLSPRPEAGRRLPAQFSLSWLLASGGPYVARAGDRRGGHPPFHAGRKGASGRLRQFAAHNLHGRGARRLRRGRAHLSRRQDPIRV